MAKFTSDNPLVFTVENRCRVCYTCVRECPAKAIKILNGQAWVISDRCIACGNCVKVCSQGAKTYHNNIQDVNTLLQNDFNAVAIIAPSFIAEFSEIDDHRFFVGMVKALGFKYISEVSFGADMIAREYRKNLIQNDKQHISSDCPAIVSYITHYKPNLITKLSPVASPMVAMARIIRKKYGINTKIVFIGPCIAKKAESTEIDLVLTFSELRTLFEQKNISFENVLPSEWDPPFSGKGAFLPISRGLLRNINKTEDITDTEVIVTDGHINFQEALSEFDEGLLTIQYLEILCCAGCIMGPGMSKNGKEFYRRTKVKNYAIDKLKNLDYKTWQKEVSEYSDLDLSQHFDALDRRLPMPEDKEIESVLNSMGKIAPEDHLNCGACGYRTCIDHAISIYLGLAEIEMCLPETIKRLHSTINQLNISNTKLAAAQQQLKQTEKLAHMGQLSAGIAHELNNPLGVITMYTNLLLEEVEPNSQLALDLKLITEQANRCKNIVGGLLNFARKNQVKLTECDINEFVKRSLQSIIIPEKIITSFESKYEKIYAVIDTDQMMQVMTNLEKNAIEAMPNGGELKIVLDGNENEAEISITDTGTGISKENMDKIFTPFFTTKEVGKGTGLGLSIIYGIVKMHNGKIEAFSNDDPNQGSTGTTFKIILPGKLINNQNLF